MQETLQNLAKAFIGESQARNRYTYYTKVAKEEGYEQIASLFAETADQEKEHAKRFFKLLEGGAVEITALYPAGEIKTTEDNLAAAAAGENLEWTKLYKEAENTARLEGFKAIAVQFKEIAEVEEEHEKRYRKLLRNLKDGKVFKKDKNWQKLQYLPQKKQGNTRP